MTTATQDITSRDGLLRAIIEEPFAIDLRHMLCDWLEEHEAGGEGVTGRVRTMHAGWMRQQLANPEQVERFVLRNWWHELPELARGDGPLGPGEAELAGDKLATVFVRQGFGYRVYCHWKNWGSGGGAAMVLWHPITEVKFADKQPMYAQVPGNYRWLKGEHGRESPSSLPGVLFRMMAEMYPGNESVGRGMVFGGRDEALEALSRTCVNLARRANRLPALQWEPLTGETTGQQAEG